MTDEKQDFSEFLTDLDNGAFHAELTAALPKAIQQCVKVQGKGTLTITLKITTRGGGNVDILPAFTVKTPVAKANGTIFFTDEEGNPTLHNPISPTAQITLRNVPTEARPPNLKVAGKKEN